MKSSSLLRKIVPLVVALALCRVDAANACLTCMGADSTTGPALNGAIFFMLGILGAVFIGIGAVVLSFWLRSRSALPPHTEFTDSASAEGDHLHSV